MFRSCEKCGGIMNYDPYFKAYVCNGCGKMERVSKSRVKVRIVYKTRSESNMVFTVNQEGYVRPY